MYQVNHRTNRCEIRILWKITLVFDRISLWLVSYLYLTFKEKANGKTIDGICETIASKQLINEYLLAQARLKAKGWRPRLGDIDSLME